MIRQLILRPLGILFSKLYGLPKLYIATAILIVYMAVLSCNLGQSFLYIGYACLMLFTLLTIRWEQFYVMNAVVPLMVFTVYCFASALWAENPDYVFDRAMFILVGVVFVCVMSNYFIQKKTLDPIFVVIAVSGIVMSLYAVIKYNGLSELVALAKKGERVGGEIANVNDIGMTCAYSTIVMFYYVFVKKRYINLPIMILPIIVAISTASRKALIILVVGILLVLLMTQGSRKDVIKYLRVIIFIFLAIVLLNYLSKLEIASELKERWDGLVDMLTTGSTKEASARIRMRMIKMGWKTFKENPLFGVGLNNAKLINERELNVDAYLHNDYIELLVNGGIVGFLLYYGVVVYLFVRHIKAMIINPTRATVRMSFVIMILFLIINAGSVNYYYSLNTYLYFTLWISVVEMIDRNELE